MKKNKIDTTIFDVSSAEEFFDLDEPVDTEIEKRVAERTGLKVLSHQTEFRGLCKRCQQKHKIKREGKNDKQ